MISKKNTLYASVFALFVVFTTNAWAQAAISPEQAQVIHQLFQTKIDDVILDSAGQIKAEGELLVEPTDSYYAVTLPRFLASQGDGSVIDYGIVALNLVPMVSSSKWMVSMALPTEVLTKNKTGDVISKMSIGSQSFSGIWDMGLNWFENMDSTWGNVVLSDMVNDTVVKVKSLTVKGTNVSGLELGTMNAVGSASFQGLTMTSQKKKGSLSINGADMTYNISDFNFDFMDELKKLSKTATSGDGEFEIAPEPKFSEMETQLSLNSLTWTTTEADSSFKIASMNTKSAYAMREEGLMDADTQLDVAGINAVGNSALTQWLPQNIKSDIQISNFPRLAMQEWVSKQMKAQAAAKKTGDKKAKTPVDTQVLKAAFVNAGTQYQINAMTIETPIGSGFDVTGQLTATEGAPYVAVGNVLLGLTGLDAATAALQKKVSEINAETPAEQEKSEKEDMLSPIIAQQGLMGIMMVQSFGKTTKNAQGQTVTTFDINLPREGGITLNGQDISALMGVISAVTPSSTK